MRALSVRDRIGLKRRVAGLAGRIESDPHFAPRVDREESARAAALFLEFARGHRLAPAEVESLLACAARDATDALDVLDGPARAHPTRSPGRDAHADRPRLDTARRTSGAGRCGPERR